MTVKSGVLYRNINWQANDTYRRYFYVKKMNHSKFDMINVCFWRDQLHHCAQSNENSRKNSTLINDLLLQAPLHWAWVIVKTFLRHFFFLLLFPYLTQFSLDFFFHFRWYCWHCLWLSASKLYLSKAIFPFWQQESIHKFKKKMSHWSTKFCAPRSTKVHINVSLFRS